MYNYCLLAFTIFLLQGGVAIAQIGFCQGDLGDPIFTEDFGSGTTNGPQLPAGVTTYTYVQSAPQDGFYTISSQMGQLGSWHVTGDHTVGDSNGKAFIVNASFTADEFYKTTIAGLCEDTSYEFSAWLLNAYDADATACDNGGIPVNVRFEIWNDTDTQLLASGNTGDINGTSNPIWEQYGVLFSTQAGQNEVILKMINNGNGGCGNDLAIDDIVFRACGAPTVITSTQTGEEPLVVCSSNAPITTTLNANNDGATVFQWQSSTDNVNWTLIAGATNNVYNTPPLSTTRYYRVNTATAAVNIGNNLCSFFSDPYLIDFVAPVAPPVSQGDVTVCDNEAAGILSVQPVSGVTINWYATPSGGQPLAEDTTSFSPPQSGTYYAEADAPNAALCSTAPRTGISYTINSSPQYAEDAEEREICLAEGSAITLNGQLGNSTYLWNTGATTPSIIITAPGVYRVTATNGVGCTTQKTFTVSGIVIPILSDVNFSDNSDILIVTENEGDFDYSLDGIIYQTNPRFRRRPAGVYTVYVRNGILCPPITRQFYHLNIPRFITPNGDGVHDLFQLADLEFFVSSTIRIYDRFGKLLSAGDGRNFTWDGTLRGKRLPEGDFWYRILIDDEVFIGHFSLVY